MFDVALAMLHVLTMVPIGNLVEIARFVMVQTTEKRRSQAKV